IGIGKGQRLAGGQRTHLPARPDDVAGEELLHVREVLVALGLAPEQHLRADLAKARIVAGLHLHAGRGDRLCLRPLPREGSERQHTRQKPVLHILSSFTKVSWTTSIPPPLNPPSQYMR